MGQAIIREFLMFLLTLVLAIPFGLFFLGLVMLANESTNDEELIVMYIVGYLLSIIAIYLFRIIVSLMYKLFAPSLEVEA